MADQKDSELRIEFRNLSKDVEGYFIKVKLECGQQQSSSYYSTQPDYWALVASETRQVSYDLIARLLPCCAALGQATRSSPLTGEEDVQDVKEATKAMRAALRLRYYSYKSAEVVHDEGVILGLKPAEQTESHHASPQESENQFFDALAKIASVLGLVEASNPLSMSAPTAEVDAATKYRVGTAFIMMWMDSAHPELNDVADTVRSIFKNFGVRAVRADDIEHEGQITDRVLNEIKSSEFLFADLTGTRPNVYYEIGYAHALGKRVILFRKAGTAIHFDLAGYNCPEYENLRDLKEKLSKRLVSLTNRNPVEEQGI